MKIEVDGQFKKFWLAYPQQWVPFYGHEIKIGKYSFCAGGTERGIVVSETSTGSRVITLPHNFLTHIMGATREGTLDYYETFVAPMLVNAIKRNDLDKMLVEMKEKIATFGIGEMPLIENADDSIIREPISDVLN
ncbi:hypothetical protein U1P98_18555 [Lysinibacillus irui]|uniref:Uncharacterized protein n=1 Tax=Lysinibacillus irui TaxID=2998077 RepID=A0ABU5NQR1_9BACI|nr:hypothetical protein [Lysinibacillus irui]MEA0556057.1 hypothetical protein [Lysinibacillus irui]MEA0978311.1 hypothetical protein [Lysinibacillus irui]MEA1044465.1 hypothetical protein [Lysinibacillus irui]